MHLLQLQLGINPHITGNKLLEYILKSQVTVSSKDYNGGMHLLQLQLGINPHITGNKPLEYILKSQVTGNKSLVAMTNILTLLTMELILRLRVT
jgi:hypothetical protein